MKKYKFIDLFAGIGGMRIAFQDMGCTCVFSSEWDENACKTYEANFGEHPYGDITKIEASEIPDFDILVAGFPCQPFSIIGDKAGFDDETQGTLFFDIERILKEKKPKAFLLENVKNLTAHDKGKTFKIIISHLEKLGYHVYWKVLNALDYGLPQKRQRIIIVGFIENINFHFPDSIPISKAKKLSDILEKDADNNQKLKVNTEIYERRMKMMKTCPEEPYVTHENIAGTITPHPFFCALRAGGSANYLLINNIRRPSPREMLRVQGFPETFKIVVNYTNIKKQTGNSVPIPMIREVAKNIVRCLDGDKYGQQYL